MTCTNSLRQIPALLFFFLTAVSFNAKAINLQIANALPNDTTVYEKADNQPGYPGGIAMFQQFIGNNIKYRDVDFDDPQQRGVVVQFTIEQDGSLSNIRTIRGTNDSLNREAIRVVSTSQKWEPGYNAGKAVRVSYILSVPFGKGAPHNSYSDELYTTVDRQPIPPGGPEAFKKFISANIRYPQKDRENKVTGNVVVEFVVEKDGTLSGFKATSGPTDAMKAEAIRVLSLSPLWRAGFWEGNKFVRVSDSVTVPFTLDAETNKQ